LVDTQHDDDINTVNIADGLNELVSRHRLSPDSVLYYNVDELAELVGIGVYAAKLNLDAAAGEFR
jgi:hypothetical protein